MSNTQKAKDVGLYFWSMKISWHRPRILQQTERDEQVDNMFREVFLHYVISSHVLFCSYDV